MVWKRNNRKALFAVLIVTLILFVVILFSCLLEMDGAVEEGETEFFNEGLKREQPRLPRLPNRTYPRGIKKIVGDLIPQRGFRLPAEYEPVRAVVFGWENNARSLSMIKQIALAVSNLEDIEIWVLDGPSHLEGIQDDIYHSIPCEVDTIWVRDYGPIGLLVDRKLGIVDSFYGERTRKLDDHVPTCLAEQLGLEVYPMNLILDGGNILVDSRGNLFMTKRTYLWNDGMSRLEVDETLRNYFNVHTIHSIDYAGYPENPADMSGHIDMFVKLLSDNKVLIAKTEDEPFKCACERAVAYFSSIKAPDSRPYTIYRVKGFKKGKMWYTYTNSLIVNNVVIIPSFSEHEEENQEAYNVYKKAMNNADIISIDSDLSIIAGGSIHCVTLQIPWGF